MREARRPKWWQHDNPVPEIHRTKYSHCILLFQGSHERQHVRNDQHEVQFLGSLAWHRRKQKLHEALGQASLESDPRRRDTDPHNSPARRVHTRGRRRHGPMTHHKTVVLYRDTGKRETDAVVWEKEKVRVVLVGCREARLRMEEKKLQWTRLMMDADVSQLLRHTLAGDGEGDPEAPAPQDGKVQLEDMPVSRQALEAHERILLLDRILKRPAHDDEDDGRGEPREGGGAGIEQVLGDTKTTAKDVRMFAFHDRQFSAALLQTVWRFDNLLSLPLSVLTSIKQQYGEHVGFYFAFINFYTLSLVVPGVLGLSVFVGCMSLSTPYSCSLYASGNEAANATDAGSCKPIDLSSTWAEQEGTEAQLCNWLLIAYMVLISMWAGLFVALWKRECVALCHTWNIPFQERNVLDFREEFKATVLSRLPSSLLDSHENSAEREAEVLKRAAISHGNYGVKCLTILAVIMQILLLSVLVTALYLIFLYCYNMKMYCTCGRQDAPECGGQVVVHGTVLNVFDLGLYGAAISWGILIEWLNWRLWFGVANYLTRLENRPTVQEHNNATVHKVFVFYFVDGMLWYLILAFGQIPVGDRITDLLLINMDGQKVPQTAFKQIFTYYIMLYLCFNQLLVLAWEWGFTAWWRRSIRKRVQRELGTKEQPPFRPKGCFGAFRAMVARNTQRLMSSSAFSSMEDDDAPSEHVKELLVESELEEFDPFFDYADIVLQFGYVVIFSVAWPGAAFACWVNNIFELRGDLAKCCRLYRRPMPRRASGIGAWLKCLEFQAWICVTMNCLLLAIATVHVDDWVAPVGGLFGMTTLVTCGEEGEQGWVSTQLIVRLIIAFVLEHIIFVARYTAEGMLGDMPKWVWVDVNLKELRAKRSLKRLVEDKRGEDGEDEGGNDPSSAGAQEAGLGADPKPRGRSSSRFSGNRHASIAGQIGQVNADNESSDSLGNGVSLYGEEIENAVVDVVWHGKVLGAEEVEVSVTVGDPVELSFDVRSFGREEGVETSHTWPMRLSFTPQQDDRVVAEHPTDIHTGEGSSSLAHLHVSWRPTKEGRTRVEIHSKAATVESSGTFLLEIAPEWPFASTHKRVGLVVTKKRHTPCAIL